MNYQNRLYQLPQKQSSKFSISSIKNQGPFPLKDITNDNLRSIARLTGSQIIKSNSSFLHSMKTYDNIAFLLGNDVKEGLSKVQSIDACQKQTKSSIYHLKKQSLALGTQIYCLRKQMSELTQKISNQHQLLIQSFSPQIKQLSKTIKKHNEIIDSQIYNAKKDLDSVNGIKKTFLDYVIDSSKRINRLQVQIGVQSHSPPDNMYTFELTQSQQEKQKNLLYNSQQIHQCRFRYESQSKSKSKTKLINNQL